MLKMINIILLFVPIKGGGLRSAINLRPTVFKQAKNEKKQLGALFLNLFAPQTRKNHVYPSCSKQCLLYA